MSSQVALSRAAESRLEEGLSADFKERAWVPGAMFLIDVCAVETALLLGILARSALSSWWPINLNASSYVGLILGILLVPIAYYLVGLHPGYGLGEVERLRRRLTVTIFVFGGLIAWDSIVQAGDWSRGVMLATFAFALVLTPLFGSLGRNYLIGKGRWGLPIVLVGTGEMGKRLARILRDEPGLGFVPIGFLSQDDVAITEFEDIPVLGHISQAGAFKGRIDTALVTVPGISANGLGSLIQDLPFPRIIMIPDLPEFPSLWVNTRDLGGVLALELRQNLLIPRNQLIKQIFDYLITVPLFILSLPVIAVAALAIKVVSPGPAFYVQKRDGLGERKFSMWKLRTMHRDAEARLQELIETDPEARAEWEIYAKLSKDPRIIPGIGHFLRKSSIDELPQFWNVLTGSMSLIGPRPFPQYHLDMFVPSFCELRARVRPGITGLWQVVSRSDADLEGQQTLDTYYIRNWSLWLDFFILLQTLPAVLLGKNGAR